MPREIHRRDWLRASAAGLAGAALVRAGGAGPDEAAEVEAKARKAGLDGFGRSESEHYLGIGDAPREYREEILAACEAIAAEFVKHFQAKKFDPLAMPDRRMTVVILAGAASYAKFADEAAGIAVGGHYEPDTNRLVVFDYRSSEGQLAATAKRINSFTLVHETMHQLTFNTGLLDRAGDVPACVSEGLATYGETWTWETRGKDIIGRVNRPRLKGLDGNTPWLRLPNLLVEDDLLEAESTRDAAYAESWVLVHAHLKEPARLPKFRAYLAAIKGRRDPKHRLDDAREHLGDLDKLDTQLRKYPKSPKGL